MSIPVRSSNTPSKLCFPLQHATNPSLTLLWSSGRTREGQNRFDGMIRWEPSTSLLALSWNEDIKVEGRRVSIRKETVFEFGTGNRDTQKQCGARLVGFLKANKHGIDRQRQFACIQGWFWTVWSAAILVSEGPPRVLKDDSAQTSTT